VFITLVAVVWGARGPSQEASSQTRWEYRMVSYAWLSGIHSLADAMEKVRTVQELEALNDDIAHRMTDLGKQGWELVCVHEKSGFVFKRKMQ
jgi:uncharacterized protein YjiS (DUF1127 family)